MSIKFHLPKKLPAEKAVPPRYYKSSEKESRKPEPEKEKPAIVHEPPVVIDTLNDAEQEVELKRLTEEEENFLKPKSKSWK